MKLILASQSPRRKQLLKGLGYEFIVDPSQSEEIFDHSISVDAALEQVAKRKAEDVLKRHPDDVILAADTIVCDKDKILGKPKDKQEAFDTLKSLSGRSHAVKTGVVLLSKNHCCSLVETSIVHFRNLTDEEIWDYVNQGTCLDKAGSYGIQDVDFADHVEGSYSNVVGLPLTRADMLLKDIQMDPAVSF